MTTDAKTEISALLAVMARLRHPENGCGWDIKQTHKTIAPYTIEEAYEVAEAVLHDNADALKDELGDLLFQVVFQARIAEENGDFDFADIAASITKKMTRRHPHIFGDNAENTVHPETWENIKAAERGAKNQHGTLDDIATALPPMTRAVKLQKRAARVGFDWDSAKQVLEKIHEELEEVTVALNAITPNDPLDENMSELPNELAGEIGDLLFTIINLARKSGIDPNNALGLTNRKFIDRFQYLEAMAAADNINIKDAGLPQMEAWWQSAKHRENSKK
ncbi:MAG: nucleoside triphosphate pyrophosphohydrolase [Candidatus Puniceispirillales bacterium WSBS_2018_MAG_OTU23]